MSATIEKYFKKYDFDKNGYLSDTELMRALPYKILHGTIKILISYFNGMNIESCVECYNETFFHRKSW